MSEKKAKRETSYSEQIIIKAARNLSRDPDKISDYMRAVDDTVSASTASVDAKIQRMLKESKD
jgi:hypothetical protein